jgi:hypothetical protein
MINRVSRYISQEMVLEVWAKECPVCGYRFESVAHVPESIVEICSAQKLRAMKAYGTHLAKCCDKQMKALDKTDWDNIAQHEG